MLDAVVLPAKSHVDGEPRADLPGVLTVEREIVVAVIALKRRRRHGQRQRARGTDLNHARGVFRAGIHSLGIDRALVLVDIARYQICESRTQIGAQVLDRVLVRAEHPVVADLDELATELELVLALCPGKVVEDLVQVLRTAKRDGVAGRRLAVTGEYQRDAPYGRKRGGRIERRADRIGAQRLDRSVQAVVDQLRRIDQRGRKNVGDGERRVLVEVGLTRAVARIRAGVDGSREVEFVVGRITPVNRRLVRQIEVDLGDLHPGVLRASAASVGGHAVADLIAGQRAGRSAWP